MINLFKSFAVMMKWTCHKHRLVYFRTMRWFEDSYHDGYRTKVMCKRCHKCFLIKNDIKPMGRLPL